MVDFYSGISTYLICRGITHTNTCIIVYVKYRLILGFEEEGSIFLWITFSWCPTIIWQPIMWAYLYSQFLHLLVSLLEVTSSAI